MTAEPDKKRPFGFEAQELPALAVAAGVGTVAIMMTLVTYGLDGGAVWPMGIGAGLVVIGLWGGIRGAVGLGVVLLAIAGMVLTRDSSVGEALSANVVVVLLAIIVLIGADLSFAMRRGSQLSAETVQGFAGVHAIAVAVGVTASVLVVGTVEAFDWPSWLVIFPIAGLAVAAVWFARSVSGYRKTVRAADARVVGQGPVKPAADASWRNFRWQSDS